MVDILGLSPLMALLIFSVLGIIITYMKVPTNARARKTIMTLAVVGVIIAVLFMFILPAVNFQWAAGGGGAYTGTFSVQISKDNTAGDWDDNIVADVDLWAAGESDCDPVDMTCTVLITATEVAGPANTIAPDEALVKLEVARTDNNPNVADADDYVNFWITAPGSVPTITNTTSYLTYDTIGSDTNGRYYMYVDDEGGDAFWIAPGETISGAWMQPGDTETVYIGIKLNPIAFGQDGQTADVSQWHTTWIVGGHSLHINLLVVAIS